MLQIEQPKIEQMIQQRMVEGGFENVEQVLLQALADAPLPARTVMRCDGPSGAEIIAVFARSPYKEVNLFPESIICPISDPVTFDV